MPLNLQIIKTMKVSNRSEMRFIVNYGTVPGNVVGF